MMLKKKIQKSCGVIEHGEKCTATKISSPQEFLSVMLEAKLQKHLSLIKIVTYTKAFLLRGSAVALSSCRNNL